MRRRTGRTGGWGSLLVLLLIVAGCQVAGQPVADPAGAAAMSASTTPSSTPPPSTTPTSTTPSSTTPSPTRSTTGPTSTAAPTSASSSPNGTDTDGDTSVPEVPTGPTSSRSPLGPTGSTGPPESTRPSTTGPAGRTLTLATDDYNFGSVISELWAQALAAKGFTVRDRAFQTSADRLAALKQGDVDAMVAFNGPLLFSLERKSVFTDRALVDKQLQAILPTGLTMTPSALADNREHVTVTAATAAKFKLKEIADLSRISGGITLAVTSDPDDATALPRLLKSFYAVTVTKTVPADLGGRRALAALTSGAATAALFDNAQYQVVTEKLVPLDDPETLFFPQNPVAIYREGKLPPVAAATLSAVNGVLTTDDVRAMQKQRFVDGMPLRNVVAAWLKAKGLG